MASDLRPEGLSIVLGGEERHFLFTLNAIDELQSRYDTTMMGIFKLLSDPKTNTKVTKVIVSVLLTDEANRAKWRDKDSTLKPVTEEEAGYLVDVTNLKEVTTTILGAYGFSMPKSDEDDDPNRESESTNK